MSFDAGAISSTLGLDVSPFTQSFLQAEGLTHLFPSIVTNFLANPLLGLIDVAKEAGAALINIFKSTTDAADNANDLATALGVDVQQLTAIGLAAEKSGSNVTGMGEALKFLEKNAADAVGGNKDAAATFAQFGISAADLKSGLNDPIDLLLQLSDGIAGIKTPGEQAAATLGVLGRGGLDSLATLKQGSSIIRELMQAEIDSGAATTKSQAERSDAWNDAVASISHAWQGFKNILAEPIRDTLLPMLNDTAQWFAAHSSEIKQFAVDVGRLVANVASTIGTVVAKLVEWWRVLEPIIGALAVAFGGPLGLVVGGGLLADSFIGATSSSSTPGTPGQPQGNTFNVNVETPAIDPTDASDQIARKISPAIRDAVSKNQSIFTATAQVERVKKGMG
jgi:hypothetical protein